MAVGAGTFHGATDLAAPKGTPLYAVADGVIDSVTTEGTPTLRIDHGNVDGKRLVVSYGHMDNPTELVKVGQHVSGGQRVSTVSDAGIANGPHLHLAVNWGKKWVDPEKFFRSHGLDLGAHATSVTPRSDATTCTVYTTAKTALKAHPDNSLDTVRVLNKGTVLTLDLNGSENGFEKVTTADGKTGFVHAYRTSTKPDGAAQPKLSYGKTPANRTYSPYGSRHLFDYPGTTEPSRGIIATIPSRNLFSTTGRTANGYTEVRWGATVGWVKLEAVAEHKTSGSNAQGSADEVSLTRDGRLVVRGWAYDTDTAWRSMPVNVFIDGRKTVLHADRSRRDVHDAFRDQISTDRVGFDWTSGHLSDGRHHIVVRAISTGGTGGQGKTLADTHVTVNDHTPRGNVDEISVTSDGQIIARGWAFDADRPNDRARVRVIIDGNNVFEITSPATDRADVRKAFPNELRTERVGYDWAGPWLTSGRHDVRVEILNAGGGHIDIWDGSVTR